MRTQYFQNIQPGHNNAVKRINSTSEVQYAIRVIENTDATPWAASSYSVETLKDSTKFKRISRDEARKIRPGAFRPIRKLKDLKPGLELATTFRQVMGNLDYKHSEKIAAIKAIRSATDAFGLAEALTVVENFDKFLVWVEEHNELPIVGSRFDANPFTTKA